MISAVVLTKNEEKNIEDCLNSLSWCDEIIVIDDDSTDNTVIIAKKLKARIYSRSLKGNFAEQRNFGMSKAINDWVLFVDADERVSAALWYEIMNSTTSIIENVSGFSLKRTDYMWGKKLKFGETGNVRLLRLAKKDSGKWIGKVHEEWKVEGKTENLKNELIHYPHNSVKNFLLEINQYTDIRALELYEEDKKISWISIVVLPPGKFLYNYFLRFGFLDGVHGLVFALMMSFHSFLVRGKLWLLRDRRSSK